MRKLAYALALVLALGIALPGCQPAPVVGTIRVVLDWTPNTNHTGLYVAQEQGYFKEEGLTVDIQQPPEDGALALLGAGSVEFAYDFQESLGPAIAKSRDALPVQAVAAVISHNTSGVLSLASTGVQTPKDLMGKRFATWGTPLVDAVMRTVVEADGGRFEDVKMIPNAATDAISALQTDVDAIWIYYAWDGVAAELAGLETNYLDFGQLDPALDFYTPVIVTNTDYAAAQPEQVKKFLKALSRGYAFAMEHPGEAADILLKYAPELDGELVRRSQDYLAARYQADASRWGEFDPARWDGFYEWMYAQGLLETYAPGLGFTNAYLP
ncbi:MAG: ABC transporter substrate-binding protein [Oscillospiraceae bacterium]|jgi:ABC-type nitrate/sulfonate/bicarbonate transport system substrate-binding protein|nr:ABC transporter substrate-binding protein [Oscillospiraceae bacterium]